MCRLIETSIELLDSISPISRRLCQWFNAWRCGRFYSECVWAVATSTDIRVDISSNIPTSRPTDQRTHVTWLLATCSTPLHQTLYPHWPLCVFSVLSKLHKLMMAQMNDCHIKSPNICAKLMLLLRHIFGHIKFSINHLECVRQHLSLIDIPPHRGIS